jgi:hypothetical protein
VRLQIQGVGKLEKKDVDLLGVPLIAWCTPLQGTLGMVPSLPSQQVTPWLQYSILQALNPWCQLLGHRLLLNDMAEHSGDPYLCATTISRADSFWSLGNPEAWWGLGPPFHGEIWVAGKSVLWQPTKTFKTLKN